MGKKRKKEGKKDERRIKKYTINGIRSNVYDQ